MPDVTFGQGDLQRSPLPGEKQTPAPGTTFGQTDLGTRPQPAPAAPVESEGFNAAKLTDDFLRSLASGVVFSPELADEFAAGMDTMTGNLSGRLGGGEARDPALPIQATGMPWREQFWKATPEYEKELAEERARDATIPLSVKIPGQITGTIASTIATRGALGKTATMKTLAQLPRWLQATGLGALFGAAFGFGAGEGGEDRAKEAAVGGATGAGTGLALHGVASTGGKLWDRFQMMRQAAKDPKLTAEKLYGRALVRDATTPAQGKEQLRKLGSQGMLADLGGTQTPGGRIVGGSNVTGLARQAANTPGPGKNTGAVRLATRAEGEGARIGKTVRQTLSPRDYFADEETVLRKLSEGAREAYRGAYDVNRSIMTPKLQRMLRESPDINAALREAARKVSNLRAAGEPNAFLGPVDNELTELARYARELGKLDPRQLPREGVARGFSLETWDQLKWGLERILDSKKYTNELTGKVNRAGYPLQRLVKALTSELDRATGGEKSLYKTARAAYGGDAEILTAMREGRDFLKLTPEEIGKKLAGLSDAAKEAYRAGAARSVLEKVDNVADQSSAANRLFNKAADRMKLEKVFPSREMFEKFGDVMRAEQRFANTSNAVGSGSRTAPMLMEAADMEPARNWLGRMGAIIGSNMPGGHNLVMAGVGRQVGRGLLKQPGQNEEVARELSRLLFSRNRAANLGVLDRVERLAEGGKLGPAEINALIELLSTGAVAGQERNLMRPVIGAAASQAQSVFNQGQ